MKKIVVFADGTGNAFSTLETNIWRLYEALDQSRRDQVVHYIQGVGTSGFKPLAALDGATGIGVPANVRQLYQFICWNWQPGDEIYMFGFSRGAFTIRTLIGLMDHEGLVPRAFKKPRKPGPEYRGADDEWEAVTQAEMERNVMGAWRAYRADTIPWWRTAPTIWVARTVRNIVLLGYHLLMKAMCGYRLYNDVAKVTAQQTRCKVPIAFVGLFDSVEAYGVPIEELRTAIDIAIWPISFRNFVMSDTVKCVRHALSLDDERTTFHPLRIDRQSESDQKRIQEVWFAGAHSDVGGGYPEDDLACVPLVWMASQIGEKLRFSPGAVDAFKNQASPYAMRHDSRAGLQAFYRYGPREVGDNGGPPVIHHSVAEKIVFGSERYAPVTLPSTALVLMPDGKTRSIRGFDRSLIAITKRNTDDRLPVEMQAANEAVSALSNPDPALVSLAQDNIWRRRVAYFFMLGAFAFVVTLPWTVEHITDAFRTLMLWAFNKVGQGTAGLGLWDWLAGNDEGSSAFLSSIVRVVGSLLPGYAKPYAEALISRPAACAIFIALAIYLFLKNSKLRDRINDFARQAWVPTEVTEVTKRSRDGFAQPIPETWVRRVRRSNLSNNTVYVFTRYVLPTFAILIFYAAVTLSISRSAVTFREGSGQLCQGQDDANLTRLQPDKPVIRDTFTTDQICWGSGVRVETGRHYTVAIEMTDPKFFDQTLITDIAGFKDASFRHLSAWFIRRWWTADWFQPIGKIGAAGTETWVLKAADGIVALPVGKDADGKNMPKHFYEDDSYAARLAAVKTGPESDPFNLGVTGKIPPDELPAANSIQSKYAMRTRFVSDFTAASDGELFLYVNDAIAAIPFGSTITSFYDNNTGRAKVTIRLNGAPTP